MSIALLAFKQKTEQLKEHIPDAFSSTDNETASKKCKDVVVHFFICGQQTLEYYKSIELTLKATFCSYCTAVLQQHQASL